MNSILTSFRAWFRRLEEHNLAAMSPAQREDIAATNAALRRHQWRILAGALCVWVAMTVVLRMSVDRIGWIEAAIITLILICSIGFAMMSAWFAHHKFKLSLRALLIVLALATSGALVGAIAGRVMKHGTLDAAFTDFGGLGSSVLMGGLIAGFVYAMLLAAVITLRRRQIEAKNAELTREAERERTARQLADARLKLMQAQVEPHFLFNTLASVQELAEGRAPEAAHLTRELIRFLRGGLASLRESTTTLADEFRMIDAYLAIMKVRMGERLTFSLNLPENLAARAVPPAMLISLVENAIKHGVEPAPAGGQITVAAEMRAAGVALMVADTGCGIGKSSASGGGVGLANVRERLNAIYGEAARLMLSEREGGGAVALIEIDDQLVAAREGT